ncbi:acyl-CoA thioesterase [Halocatena pleomorpha]|uniref:Acyl-CoA thioesterase n=1 Tax=Halocatena pleomorpha TaxID=1785090 RepID=A0A3P3R7G4_9EURY|nr:acyl-CoA thioesterase [Halocatena pleomorpha]RRJ28570.1 acyl-CoA thioesterase [Halocatena pleomorpha]
MPDLLDTYMENRWLIQPNHANILETAHGGYVLKWMDEVGAMASMRFSQESCVTAHINHVDFQRPIMVGDLALIEAYVYDVGQTSMRVRLRAYREDPQTGTQEQTTESYFVYVAIDEDRDPTPVPELTVSTERGKQLQADALSGENGDG